jgi:hypothetical protein
MSENSNDDLIPMVLYGQTFLTHPREWGEKQHDETDEAYFYRLVRFSVTATHWLCEEEDSVILNMTNTTNGKIYPFVEMEDGEMLIMDDEGVYSAAMLVTSGRLLVLPSD